jgi:sugar phosphate permease
MFEGPLIPAITKSVHMWVIPKERGMASGLWMAALPTGVVVGNPLSGFIIERWGWQSVFFLYASFGLLVAYISWILLRNRPEEHPKISKQELNLIKSCIDEHEGADRLKATGSTVSQLLRNPWTWVISILYVCTASVFWVNLNWLPTYFVNARGSGLLKSGFISAVPWVAGAMGAFFYGWLSDHFGKIRGVWLAVAYFIMAPFIALAVNTPSLTNCLLFFVIAVFLNMGCLGLLYAIPMEIFAPPDVGKASGIMLGWGSASGVLAPTIVGFIVQYTNSFNAAYYVFALVSVLGGLLSFALIAKERATLREKTMALAQKEEAVA